MRAYASGGARTRFSEINDWPGLANSESLITHIGTIDHEDNSDSPDRKVAIAIAPDDMRVSSTFIDKAAEAAVHMPGPIHILVIVAFEFEAMARSGDFEKRGKLTIAKVQANRDLQIGTLKDNDSDHAFVMIGEPDVTVEKLNAGMISVEVLGFDTFNPATGNIAPGGARDIDCWMLDTCYNGESFFARHIHFPNKSSDPQLAKLKRALGAKIDQVAWDAMLSFKSRPFAVPKLGRLAVRIVTNTHTEMTTVIDCASTK